MKTTLKESRNLWKGIAISFIIMFITVWSMGFYFEKKSQKLEQQLQIYQEQVPILRNPNSISFWKYNGTNWNSFVCVGDVYVNGNLSNFSVTERLTCYDGENCEVSK